MSKQLVSIIDVPKHIGEEITIGAWVEQINLILSNTLAKKHLST